MPIGHALPHIAFAHVGIPALHPGPPSYGSPPPSGLFVPGAIPPASGVEHAFVHEPQCARSDSRSTHMELHFVAGGSHSDLHWLCEQT